MNLFTSQTVQWGIIFAVPSKRGYLNFKLIFQKPKLKVYCTIFIFLSFLPPPPGFSTRLNSIYLYSWKKDWIYLLCFSLFFVPVASCFSACSLVSIFSPEIFSQRFAFPTLHCPDCRFRGKWREKAGKGRRIEINLNCKIIAAIMITATGEEKRAKHWCWTLAFTLESLITAGRQSLGPLLGCFVRLPFTDI